MGKDTQHHTHVYNSPVLHLTNTTGVETLLSVPSSLNSLIVASEISQDHNIIGITIYPNVPFTPWSTLPQDTKYPTVVVVEGSGSVNVFHDSLVVQDELDHSGSTVGDVSTEGTCWCE